MGYTQDLIELGLKYGFVFENAEKRRFFSVQFKNQYDLSINQIAIFLGCMQEAYTIARSKKTFLDFLRDQTFMTNKVIREDAASHVFTTLATYDSPLKAETNFSVLFLFENDKIFQELYRFFAHEDFVAFLSGSYQSELIRLLEYRGWPVRRHQEVFLFQRIGYLEAFRFA